MIWIIYILSIPAFYFAFRQLARRNDNEKAKKIAERQKRLEKINMLSRPASQRLSSSYDLYGDIYESDADKMTWSNKTMIIIGLLSLVIFINTFVAMWCWAQLFFTHESVIKWFKEKSKL